MRPGRLSSTTTPCELITVYGMFKIELNITHLTEAEFKGFEPCRLTANNRFQLSNGSNLETLEIFR